MKSFVDILTIDYRKTLNDYKNKIMDDIRKKTVSKQFNSGSNLTKRITSQRDVEQSFVDILKGDHSREVFESKSILRNEASKKVVAKLATS
jgi:hypothetical protein